MRITIETNTHDESVSVAYKPAQPSQASATQDAGRAPVGLAARNGMVQEPPPFTTPPPYGTGTLASPDSTSTVTTLSAGPAPSLDEIAR
ncbi:hypothetical protein ACFYR1_51095 [Streptomyces canus]|uniref:hypothetical protein n=1 Tax=Streptomyces canus TaxID=58343 RepID=UPI00367BC167